ncbi:hypothetical protein KIS1582_1307 [Cytobacillus firmus]|uniref:Uncharacterized protein n=1 Tax=Cytobacillus firmus TaxID=1399 RepID=A0A800NBT9_CYTFI|nr:hypothetical protein KIS1582_1307 [Cytobacillus firmus]
MKWGSYCPLAWAVLHLAIGTALFAILCEAGVFASSSSRIRRVGEKSSNPYYG